MLSVNDCKKILNKTGSYTDDEVKKIRQFLYELVEIEYYNFKNNNNNERSNLHKSIDRRTERKGI